ncbi:MAG: transposase [Elusimicrobia bacterium]|nr:transposase [Elusimicrobiota bacterium]
MPRQARLDMPGFLYHIIARGLERRPIFIDEEDRTDFLSRVEKAFERAPTPVYAWALMPNHFHLLVQAGVKGLAPFMRSLMSGYAGSFNHRHKRQGYLFQNRFKSIICEEGPYFLELVRYIHLNPVRARIVKNMDELKDYPWTGHSALLSGKKPGWQNTQKVLEQFSMSDEESRKRYENFVFDGLGMRRREDLMGGGLRRSLGGHFERGQLQAYDSQVLGSGGFVEDVLNQSEKLDKEKLAWISVDIQTVVDKIADKLQVNRRLILTKGRKIKVSKAKSLLVFAGVAKLGQTQKRMADLVCMTPSAVARAMARGESLWKEFGFEETPQVN